MRGGRDPTVSHEESPRSEEVRDRAINTWWGLGEWTVGREEREVCAMRRGRGHEDRVNGRVMQQDEARGGTGLLGLHVEDGAVDRSQFREVLKIGIAGQPSFWKQGRELLRRQGGDIPLGL